MKLIKRNRYLEKLIHTVETPDIKVIAGIRRSGKSKLLEAFIDYVKKNYINANIIHINFNLMKFDSLKTAQTLNDFIEDSYKKSVENFVFIDEIQMCEDFEKVINSIHAEEKFHIYITGSNAFLLSSDLATLFTGRTFEIKVFPFSFSEYLEYFKEADIQKAFDDYAKYGGMAGSYLYKTENEKYDYIADVFKTLIVRDIQQKYKIRNINLLSKVSDFLIDNISTEVSTHSIANTLTSAKDKTNNKTISAYLKYLCSSFAFYKIRRYDIRGKKYLSSQDKYYLADHSFKYALLGTKNLDYGRCYENIVAMELLRRGYELYAGVLYKKEIDFVAIKQNEKIYIQVSDDISNEKTFEREITPLLSIKDAYPKVIIARTRHEEYSKDGVRIIDIATWLKEGRD
ncbi:ATP-binding protein [Treponema sp.]|uniref:ATP-binding protein n=1 Tax=Treponema sp. TaxID=166 RepID=UPI00298EB80C|nr:ATP-binding protein [Treponema sp.]MCR5613499.1 ATP-binding protein [Treponema sp.]